MNKKLVLAVLLLLSTSIVSAEVDVNYFGEIMTSEHNEDTLSVDWSPDGTKFVSSSWTGGVQIWDANGNILYNFSEEATEIWTVKWSPDGTRIASASAGDDTVSIWNASNGEEISVLTHSTAWSLDWSPDGTKILSGNTNGQLTLWDLATETPILNLGNHTGLISCIEWSPDGTKIASGHWPGIVAIRNASTYEIIDTYSSANQDVQALSWSPDGTKLAFGGHGDYFTIIDTLSGSRIDVPIYDGIWGISWSPDGNKIATAMMGSNVLIWSADGVVIRTLTGHTTWVEDVAWSPDGTKIISGSEDETLRIWGDLREVIAEQDETIQQQQNVISGQNNTIQQQQNVILGQNETIQGQQNTLNNISSDITRFEQAMQTTFDNPDFALVGSTPDEKVNTLVDVLVQTANSAMKEIYRLLGYK